VRGWKILKLSLVLFLIRIKNAMHNRYGYQGQEKNKEKGRDTINQKQMKFLRERYGLLPGENSNNFNLHI